MTMDHRNTLLLRTTVVALLFGSAAGPGFAQTTGPGLIGPPSRPERPYRGIFGGGSSNVAQSLTLEGSFGGGFVDNPVAEQGAAPITADPSRSSGGSGTGSATITYSMDRKRFGVSATHKTLIDYYPQLGQASMWDRHFLSGMVYYQPSLSTRISVMPAFKNVAELSASDLFDQEFGESVPLVQDFALTLARYHRYGAVVEVSHAFSQRMQIQADLNYGHGKIGEDKEWLIFTGSGTFSYGIAKGIALSVGYRDGGQRDIVEGQSPESLRHPRIMGGLDLNRPLSFSRRTLLTLSSGLAGTQDRHTKETVFHAIGGARLVREFGRTWNASFGYDRGLRRIEPLGDDILTDSVAGGVQGSFSQRLQFQSRIGYASGTVSASGGHIKEQFAGMQLSFALNKIVALGADYSHNRYSATEDALPGHILGERNSGSVHGYLELWVPLFTRTKRQ
jgi:hypothetical protein